MELQFVCDRGVTAERGHEEAEAAWGPDYCQHVDPWPVTTREDPSGLGRVVVYAADAHCPDCGGSGHALSDETVHILPDPVEV